MKETGKKVRKILILTLSAALIIGLYYFCSRKEKDNNDKISANDPYSIIVSRDLGLNYPSTPKAVVTFYSDIMQQMYNSKIDDDKKIFNLKRFIQKIRKKKDDTEDNSGS